MNEVSSVEEVLVGKGCNLDDCCSSSRRGGEGGGRQRRERQDLEACIMCNIS